MGDFNLIEGDVTLKPDQSFPPAGETVMIHDHSGTGFPAWEVLGNGGAAFGVVSFDGKALNIISPDVMANTAGGQSFGANALRRHTRPAGKNRVYLAYDWRLRVFRSGSGVFTYSKGIDLGIDTADWGRAGAVAGGPGGMNPLPADRTLAFCRFVVQDENDGNFYNGKWQLVSGSADAPTYLNLTDLYGNVIQPAAVQALSVTNGQTSATYAGGPDPVVGATVFGTSIPIGTIVAAVNTSTKTVTLSSAATATSTTPAGACVSCGYEALAKGSNYEKWVQQRTELVFDLTPQVIPLAQTALSVTSGQVSASYTGSVDPVVGGRVVGTSVNVGAWITSVNPGAKTVTLDRAATATSTSLAGASFGSVIVTARLEGLRHNGVGFGSLAGSLGYQNDITKNPRANELLALQCTPDASRRVAPALSQDVGFQGGLNMCAQVTNRSNQLSKATLQLLRARMGAF